MQHKHVKTCAAAQRVVAGAAKQPVRAAVTFQPVIETRADQVLDVEEKVALRVAPSSGGPIKANGDASRGAGVSRGVHASATVEDVAALAAKNEVIAGATVNLIIASTAIEAVGVLAAGQGIVASAARDDVSSGSAGNVVIGRGPDQNVVTAEPVQNLRCAGLRQLDEIRGLVGGVGAFQKRDCVVELSVHIVRQAHRKGPGRG